MMVFEEEVIQEKTEEAHDESIHIEPEVKAQKQMHKQVAKIKVIGVGGAGGNTVNSMIEAGYEAIDFIVANTDAQALHLSKAHKKIQVGVKSTKGLGSGANPEIGKRSAEEDMDKIMQELADADIVFLAAGMGGGTGSGGLPVIAKALKDKGILSIAVVTKPFSFEGKRRMKVAQEAIDQLKKDVDTLIVVPNQKLLDVADSDVSMIDAFGMINDVLNRSVKGISDIITKPGHINVDFADLRAIMKDMGIAVLGTGSATGPDRAMEAALKAIESPLLENVSIKGAKSVLLNITGGPSLGLHEIHQAASLIYEQADEDANIILGSVIDESLGEEIVMTVVATGFSDQSKNNDGQSNTKVEVKPSVKQDTVAPEITEPKYQPYYAELLDKKENALVDMKSLDVPTFLRNDYQEQQSE
jgi:cell division protein FtsZ